MRLARDKTKQETSRRCYNRAFKIERFSQQVHLQCSAHSKAVLDDSLIIVDTISLDQHNLDYCTIDHLYEDAMVNEHSKFECLENKDPKDP